MPSHTPAEAFIKLWCEDEIPWRWPAWQSLTGISHGLFPADGTPPLLAGAQLMSETFVHILISTWPKGRKKPKNDSLGKGREERWFQVAGNGGSCLSEERIHPFTLLCNSTDKWPPGDMWIPLAIDSIALKLFGPESMDHTGERALSQIRVPIQICAQKSWDTLRRQYIRGRKDLERYEKSATEAFADLDSPPVTKAKIGKAMRLLNRWKLLAELFELRDHLDRMTEMTASMARLLQAMGKEVAEPPADGHGKGMLRLYIHAYVGLLAPFPDVAKLTQDMLTQLASEDDVADLVRLYDDLFSTDQGEVNSFAARAEVDEALCKLPHDGDVGVDVELSMDENRLSHELGFAKCRPFQFSALRHHLGLNGWDHPGLLESLVKTQAVAPIRLHWHQLAGVHAIIRSLFHDRARAGACRGVLVADEVGLGKTVIALSAIAFLNHAIWLKASNKPVPPVLEKLPYLGNSDTIPKLPHLIVVPGTLVSQWEQEAKKFLLPKKMDILIYTAAKGQQQVFWSKSGPLANSKHEEQQKLIIASHSALQSDFLSCYKAVNKARGRKPWDLPNIHNSDVSNTLFGQRYLTVTIDEIHHMRNVGVKYYACLRLREQTQIMLGLTATPLQTAPKDILAIGRIIGVPDFLDDQSFEDEKNDMRAQRRAKQNVTAVKDEPEEEQEEAANALRLTHLSAIARMHKTFANHMIRRTTNSKDHMGRPLVTLPPCVDIHAVLKLTDREMNIILDLDQNAKDSISTANGLRGFATKNFYLEYRMAFGFAREDPDTPIPVFKTLEEWAPVKSTKVDLCARLCKYLLSRDDAPPISFHDGEASFPRLEPAVPSMQKRRILIYQEFPSLGPLLRNVLALYGVECCYIDGQLTLRRRREVVEKFHSPGGPRVMIFSSVGTAGLNLSIADTIVLLDQPWSAQDERQIRGRAHRQPQKKTVHVYHLLADNTTDILLSGMAQGKQELLEAFLNQKSGAGKSIPNLVRLLSGKALDDDDDEAIDEETPALKRKRRPDALTDGVADGMEADGDHGADSDRVIAKPDAPKASASKALSQPNRPPSPNASARPLTNAVNQCKGKSKCASAPGTDGAEGVGSIAGANSQAVARSLVSQRQGNKPDGRGPVAPSKRDKKKRKLSTDFVGAGTNAEDLDPTVRTVSHAAPDLRRVPQVPVSEPKQSGKQPSATLPRKAEPRSSGPAHVIKPGNGSQVMVRSQVMGLQRDPGEDSDEDDSIFGTSPSPRGQPQTPESFSNGFGRLSIAYTVLLLTQLITARHFAPPAAAAGSAVQVQTGAENGAPAVKVDANGFDTDGFETDGPVDTDGMDADGPADTDGMDTDGVDDEFPPGSEPPLVRDDDDDGGYSQNASPLREPEDEKERPRDDDESRRGQPRGSADGFSQYQRALPSMPDEAFGARKKGPAEVRAMGCANNLALTASSPARTPLGHARSRTRFASCAAGPSAISATQRPTGVVHAGEERLRQATVRASGSFFGLFPAALSCLPISMPL
ncbi:P-loop containing nucleoside triphosphate hydrolase protein [Infundibulicybe gibba]|nr:P-loop containing nucleoside triphosphate hydrolase protein [Infundibulicybe gibba]